MYFFQKFRFWQFIFTCLFKTSYANEKIAFINIDRIINQSNFGKKIYTKLDSDYAKEDKKLKTFYVPCCLQYCLQTPTNKACCRLSA